MLDRATLALIFSLIAITISVAKMVYDLLRPPERRRSKIGRQSQIRIETLTEGTNCFITRSGYLLFLISFRIYNGSDQRSISISETKFRAKIGRKWRESILYETPQANIFLSLFRHNLPLVLGPEERQDFYEVFAIEEIIPSTKINVSLEIYGKTGKLLTFRETLQHQLDDRPVFDLLFRILE